MNQPLNEEIQTEIVEGESKPIVILFADKDPINAIKIKKFLTRIIEPFDLQYLRDGITVLEYLMKKPPYADAPTPDLLVLTPDLPLVDMYQVAKIVSTGENGPKLKEMVVLLFEPDVSLKRAKIAFPTTASPVHPFTYLIANYLDRNRQQYLNGR